MRLLQRWKRWLGIGASVAVPLRDPLRSFRDDLTGLASRMLMHDTLAAALRSQASGVVVLLDIDNFKYFNDRHGQIGRAHV